VILDKETTPTARSILYSALSKLDGHPLQIWAQEQFSAYQAIITKVFEAYQAEVDATRHRESTEKRVEVLSAELKALEGEMELVRDNPDQRQTLQARRISKSEELQHAEAEEEDATQAARLAAEKKAQLFAAQAIIGASAQQLNAIVKELEEKKMSDAK
jgi:hypothetical protein